MSSIIDYHGDLYLYNVVLGSNKNILLLLLLILYIDVVTVCNTGQLKSHLLLLFESLHDSRPMLGAGSSSGVELFQVFMGTRLWQDGQTSRCFMVCSSPHSHVVCPSSLNHHFCIRDLHRPVPVRRRFRLDQVGHVSHEPGGSDSLGLNESLCGVVWRSNQLFNTKCTSSTNEQALQFGRALQT